MKLQPTQSSAYVAQLQSIQKTQPVQNAETRTAKDVLDQVQLSAKVDETFIQRTLSTTIGQKVDEMLKANGLDINQLMGVDWSPEATSQRIFDFTTSFFDMYRMQHEDESLEEQIAGFEKMVRGAVGKGYQEAVGILNGYEVDKGSLSVAEETMSQLYKKYDEFFAGLRSSTSEEDGVQA